jgi:multicomponent Na+:H+ antiporter subunit F
VSTFLAILALMLLATFVGGLVRIVRGPTRADRMMAAQLFGTTGVAVLLVLSRLQQSRALVDVALVVALLAVLAVVVFVFRGAAHRHGGPHA